MKENKDNCLCEIEAIVSFDDRGQLVIPKDLRKKFNLKAGDRFALISCVTGDVDCENGDSSMTCCDSGDGVTICCFTLISTKQLNGMMGAMLGTVMPNIANPKKT